MRSASPSRSVYVSPLVGTVRLIRHLAQSVRQPCYTLTHAILICWQRVHAADALTRTSSRSHTSIQTGGLRVWMRSAHCRLSPRASNEFFLLVPRLPSWPQGRGVRPRLYDSFSSPPFPCHSSMIVMRLVAHRTHRALFRAAGSPLLHSRVYVDLDLRDLFWSGLLASICSRMEARLWPSYFPLWMSR